MRHSISMPAARATSALGATQTNKGVAKHLSFACHHPVADNCRGFCRGVVSADGGTRLDVYYRVFWSNGWAFK